MASAFRWTAARRRIVAPLLVVAAIVVVFLPLTPAYDVHVFLHAGYGALHGLQVYPSPGTPAVYAGSSFVYPYVSLLPFLLLGALPVTLGTTVFFAISVSAVIAACLLTTDGGPERAVLVLATAFTITGLQLGALSPLLFAGAVFLWRMRARPVVFVLAGPIVAGKLFLAPLLLWLLLARRHRALAWASASTITLLAVGFILGPIDPGQYLRILSELGAHEARSGFGLIGALMNAGFAMIAAQASALALTLVVLVAVHLHYQRTRDERVLFCAGLVASLLLTPVLWSHYLVLLAAGLLAFEAPRRWFVVLALASWGIAPPHGVGSSGVIQAAALAAAVVSGLVITCSAVLARETRGADSAGAPPGARSITPRAEQLPGA